MENPNERDPNLSVFMDKGSDLRPVSCFGGWADLVGFSMNTLRKTVPSKLLFDPDSSTQLRYVPAAETDLRQKWQQFFDYHAKPVNDSDYQAEQMAEHGYYPHK